MSESSQSPGSNEPGSLQQDHIIELHREFAVGLVVQKFGGSSLKDAERVMQQTDAQRERYHREHYGRDWSDPVGYHMVLNTERLGYDGTVAIIVAEAGRRGWK